MNLTSPSPLPTSSCRLCSPSGSPTLLMGMSLPLAIKSAASASQVGRDVGVVYALNTLGAILGVIATSFVLIPSVGLTFTFELFALDRCHYRGDRPVVAPCRTALCHGSDRCYLRS